MLHYARKSIAEPPGFHFVINHEEKKEEKKRGRERESAVGSLRRRFIVSREKYVISPS